MAITRVQSTKTAVDGGTSVSVAFPSNVTAGNLIVVAVFRGSNQAQGSSPILATDCTKSAGTATIGTFVRDSFLEQSLGANGYSNVAVLSAEVTGTGSCTIQVANGPSSSYWGLMPVEYSNADTSGTRLADSTTGSGSSTTPLTTSGTSGGPGVFVGVMTTFQSGATTITPQAAFSQIQEEEDGTLHQVGASEDQIVTADTTDAAEWTISPTGSWCAALAIYKEVSSSVIYAAGYYA